MAVREVPERPGAYMDADRKIWLLELDQWGWLQWRLPGGVITRPGTRSLEKAFAKSGPLRRMIVSRRE